MEQWSEGIYLLGQYEYGTGCWLLTHGQRGAILELPPVRVVRGHAVTPVMAAQQAAEQLGIQIDTLLCTHYHRDHISLQTMQSFLEQFPTATLWLQRGFQPYTPAHPAIRYFDEAQTLYLDGEPLYLIHAPKHSWTDTIVIFRGVACTGDWELNTIRSVNTEVPYERKIQSIRTLAAFPEQYNYRIHKIFSAHANDWREQVDFPALMNDTRNDKAL